MNIYVSNLGFQVGDDDLKDIFTACGEVTSAKVILDRETNKSRGFGFVEMPNDAEGEAAISKLNGSDIGGRPISVTVARPKERSGGFKPGFKKSNNSWR